MALYAFDGTWMDSERAPESEFTNVRLFKDLYLSDEQRPGNFYYGGPGTRYGEVGKRVGGYLGLGADKRVREARSDLSKAYVRGDATIDIVGFSRGAAEAVAFAWSLFRRGIREDEPDGKIGISGRRLASKPPIRFLGLFDTVFTTEDLNRHIPLSEYRKADRSSMGIFNRGIAGSDPQRFDMNLPGNVKAAFHALSIHEATPGFAATRFTNANEVWFPGVHGDVGGGTGDRGLADTALRWMLEMARSHGVPVGDHNSTEGTEGDQLASALQKLPKKPGRTIRSEDRVHETAISLPLGIDRDEVQIAT